MGRGGTHGGTTYKGYTIPHNKRWYTVAGKGLCAVTWFWIFYRAKQDIAMLLGMLCVTSSIILTSSNIFYLAFLFFQQTVQEIHNLMRQDDTIWSVKHKICSGHVFVGAMGCVIHHKYHKKDDNTMSAKYDESKEMEVLKDPTQSPCINQVLIASLMLGVNLVVLQ